jgi:hypothetical protein
MNKNKFFFLCSKESSKGRVFFTPSEKDALHNNIQKTKKQTKPWESFVNSDEKTEERLD